MGGGGVKWRGRGWYKGGDGILVEEEGKGWRGNGGSEVKDEWTVIGGGDGGKRWSIAKDG